MGDIFHQRTGTVKESVGLGASFERPGFTALGTFWHLVLGNDLQELVEEVLLFSFGARLSDSDAEHAR